jgi:hypothetical protein
MISRARKRPRATQQHECESDVGLSPAILAEHAVFQVTHEQVTRGQCRRNPSRNYRVRIVPHGLDLRTNRRDRNDPADYNQSADQTPLEGFRALFFTNEATKRIQKPHDKTPSNHLAVAALLVVA